MRCSHGANGRRRSKRSSARSAATNASCAMSSAAAVSCTIRYAARCADGQWRRNSSSTASLDPSCAARTSDRSRASAGPPGSDRPRRAGRGSRCVAMTTTVRLRSRDRHRSVRRNPVHRREQHRRVRLGRCRAQHEPGRAHAVDRVGPVDAILVRGLSKTLRRPPRRPRRRPRGARRARRSASSGRTAPARRRRSR